MTTINLKKKFSDKPHIIATLFIILCFLLNCSPKKIKLIQRHSNPNSTQIQSYRPYRVLGKTYYPISSQKNFTQSGIASWYGPKFHGKLTSNKERYNMHRLTAAHKTLPFNTIVRVTNIENGLDALVRINDRGPFVDNRIIDLSLAAAKKLDMIENGTAIVELKAEYFHNQTNNARKQTVKKYGIQIGSFRELQNAKNLKNQIKKSSILKLTSENNQYYRGVIGNYNHFDQAWNLLTDLKSNGFPKAFIIDY